MKSRSSASTPPVSANTVCTFQPRSCRYGTQKLVSRPPEKSRTMSLLAMDCFSSVDVSTWVAGKELGKESGHQRCHDRLLHVQSVLGFVDGDAVRRIHHRVAGLDVAAQRQAV